MTSLYLDPTNLTHPKEQRYYSLIVVFSVLCWIVVAVTIVGIVYALLIGLFLWLANGLLVAALRAEAVRINPSQLPAMHRSLEEICGKLGMRQVPELYLLQSGGMLNAFATRHSGRDFIVIYSDFLEAFGADADEMKFVLGHELGHIQRKHILKNILLLPGLLLPLLGNAYRRACESTCDRYGYFAAANPAAAIRAMMTLAGGREQGRNLQPEVFAQQYERDRGFFVSWHELISGYPTLSRRVADLLALQQGRQPVAAPRHPLSYLFGMFSIGGGYGGSTNLLMTVIVIGLLAAMAIPAFQRVRMTSEGKICGNNQRMLEAACSTYLVENGQMPQFWEDFVGEGKSVPAMPVCPKGGEYGISFSEDDGNAIPEANCSVHGTRADIQAAFRNRDGN